ncbi:MAG: hypothetical protein PSX81_08085 [bacterium]|nr:hypothetical protein [bacterium]
MFLLKVSFNDKGKLFNKDFFEGIKKVNWKLCINHTIFEICNPLDGTTPSENNKIPNGTRFTSNKNE